MVRKEQVSGKEVAEILKQGEVQIDLPATQENFPIQLHKGEGALVNLDAEELKLNRASLLDEKMREAFLQKNSELISSENAGLGLLDKNETIARSEWNGLENTFKELRTAINEFIHQNEQLDGLSEDEDKTDFEEQANEAFKKVQNQAKELSQKIKEVYRKLAKTNSQEDSPTPTETLEVEDEEKQKALEDLNGRKLNLRINGRTEDIVTDFSSTETRSKMSDRVRALIGNKNYRQEGTSSVADAIDIVGLQKGDLESWPKVLHHGDSVVNHISSFDRNISRDGAKAYVEKFESRWGALVDAIDSLHKEIESKQSTESTPASEGEEKKEGAEKKERVEGQQPSTDKVFSSRRGPFPVDDEKDATEKVSTEATATDSTSEEKDDHIIQEAMLEGALDDIKKDAEYAEEVREKITEIEKEMKQLANVVSPVYYSTHVKKQGIEKLIAELKDLSAPSDEDGSEIAVYDRDSITEKYNLLKEALDDFITEIQGSPDGTEVAKQEEEKEETPLRKVYLEQKEARKAYYDALKSKKKNFQSIRGIRALTGEGMTDELKGLKDDFENKYQAYLETRSNVYQQEERGTDKEGESLEKRELNINRRVEREALMLLHAQAESEPGRFEKSVQKVSEWVKTHKKTTVGVGVALLGGSAVLTGGTSLIAAGAGLGAGWLAKKGTESAYNRLGTKRAEKRLETEKKAEKKLENIHQAIEARRRAESDVLTSEKRKKVAGRTMGILTGFGVGGATFNQVGTDALWSSDWLWDAVGFRKDGAAGLQEVDKIPSDVVGNESSESSTGAQNESIKLDERGEVVPKEGSAEVKPAIKPDVEFETPPQTATETPLSTLDRGYMGDGTQIPSSDTTPPVTPEQNVDAGNEVVPTQEETNNSQSFEGALPPDDAAQSFEGDGTGFIDPITVEKGDTLWDHMEKTFADQLSGLSPSQQDVVLDRIVDYLETNPELGNQIGVGPDPHLIHPGDTLNLNPLTSFVEDYVVDVQGQESAPNAGAETPPPPQPRPEASVLSPEPRPEAPAAATAESTVESRRPDFESYPQRGEAVPDSYWQSEETPIPDTETPVSVEPVPPPTPRPEGIGDTPEAAPPVPEPRPVPPASDFPLENRTTDVAENAVQGGVGNETLVGGAGADQLDANAPFTIGNQPVTLESYAQQAPIEYLKGLFPPEGGFLGIGGSEGGINSPEWGEMGAMPAENFLDPGAFERMNVGTAEQRTAIAELVGDLQAQSGMEPENSQSVAKYLSAALPLALQKGYRLPNVS